MANKTKLELTWIGKDQRPRLEPRILLENSSKSFHAGQRYNDNDVFDNRLIHGDNLLALKALEQEFLGRIKCVYIDPPFNTGEAFEHYEDGMEHSVWMSLMRDRIEILHKLLQPSGTFCVHIDDNELGYLITMADEIFGRRNRCYIVTFKQSSVSGPKSVNPGLVTTGSYILIYAKDKSKWEPNKVFTPTARDSRYNKYIENYDASFEDWKLITLREALTRASGLEKTSDLKKKFSTKDKLETALERFVLSEPTRVVRTARVAPKDIAASCRTSLQKSAEKKGRVFKGVREGKSDIYFLNGEQLIFYSSKVKNVDGKWITGVAASTIWDDLLSNNLHNEGQVRFPNGKKPEGLLKRILDMTTDEGDWVLDSFGGSGTTAAVAQKMMRKWIMVELGNHCEEFISPRLQRVISGTDDSGVTKACAWRGGGGYRYFTLAPSLLEKDKFGNWIINKKYNKEMLVEALCKLEGFQYKPSESVYWQHGHSTENDFIYVTTQTLTKEQIQKISDEVGPKRSLLICCGAFRIRNLEEYPNLTLKKIPRAVMAKCEWGKDDYSLEIKNLAAAPEPEPDPDAPEKPKPKRRRAKPSVDQMGLFEMEGAE